LAGHFSNALGFRAPNALFLIAFFAGALLNLARDWLRSRQMLSLALVCVGKLGVAYNMSPAFDFMRLIRLPDLSPVGADFGSAPRLFWNSFGSIALVAGVIGSRPVDRILTTRPLVFLGRISFSMYLLHVPILMSVALWSLKSGTALGMSYGIAAGLTFAIYITALIAAATLFFRAVDAPSIRLAAYLADRRGIFRPNRNRGAAFDQDTKRQDALRSV